MSAGFVANAFSKPARRSKIRKALGKYLYCSVRYLGWLVKGNRYARYIQTEPLAHIAADHSTPLIRDLRGLDMWLQHNKVINLGIAAQKLNGILIKPGQTFSFWRLVGKPTAAKGYLPGMTLVEGNLRPGLGGGLCQLTNLIYWMALHTPLTVTERHRHSYDVFPDSSRTQPFGSGATCSYNYLDLQITNSTQATFQLLLALEGGFLFGCWRCTETGTFQYEIYEKEHRFLSDPWGGYIRHNVICRKVFDLEGTLLYDEFIAENNARMLYHPLIEAPMASDHLPSLQEQCQ